MFYTQKLDKDSCGFGLSAHIFGEPSHSLVTNSIDALSRLAHRGAILADGQSSDGCGVLFSMPIEFLQKQAKNIAIDIPENCAIGVVFCELNGIGRVEADIQELLEIYPQLSLHLIGKRLLPVNPAALGRIALETQPETWHLFFAGSGKTKQMRIANLFLFSRLLRQKLSLHASQLIGLSEDSLVYKGLMMPNKMQDYFLDLQDSEFEASICIFHQRFSTNTLPQWHLAQPFSKLAHNGEINTCWGNRRWAQARKNLLMNEYLNIPEALEPVVDLQGSDSSSLNDMLELMCAGGMSMLEAIRILVPPAWQNNNLLNVKEKAYFAYNAMRMEPWDGPAGLVMTDGRYALCCLDRNGLRPARWTITSDNIITLASEIGVHDLEHRVIESGRVSPGQILAVDIEKGEVLQNDTIIKKFADEMPYRQWLQDSNKIESTIQPVAYKFPDMSPERLREMKQRFGYSREEEKLVLTPLITDGQEGIGSMGDDTPIAALSEKKRLLTDYFRQSFAQVTNPPIDSLRETNVMSLETIIGKHHNFFDNSKQHTRKLVFHSPVVSPKRMEALLTEDLGWQHAKLSLYYSGCSLKEAIHRLIQDAKDAAENGCELLVLSDRQYDPEKSLIPMLMAIGAIHNALIDSQQRLSLSLIVETAYARDPHQFAVFLAYGADIIYPYFAYALIASLVESRPQLYSKTVFKNFRKAINKGLLKIMSKMGISCLASYRGAQLFEALGLSQEVVDLCFQGTSTRIAGMSLARIEQEQEEIRAIAANASVPAILSGVFKFEQNGEYHTFNPDVVTSLIEATKLGDYQFYKDYFAAKVNGRKPAALRDLLELSSDRSPIPLEEVEPVEEICTRFDSAAMSLGALSPEAHETLAMAMNQLGGRSNSGEGGEDPKRYNTNKTSKIKQVASGRFGVTAAYLRSAEVIQIKIAQGAKPGEGGQLPGKKVNKLIAELRYSVPGVTLISPPPHHDIYSIEDIKQLIFDLKQVNPKALVSVKLVSLPGVGTIASGIAKAYADLITISGHDGGTGASPLSSIRHAGSPWEIGLVETVQSLRANELRSRVRIQTDGGLKTGLDVVKAAILGAESFGFGTAAMISMGCKYLRICHLNNCATGVTTQNAILRNQHFQGNVDRVVSYFRFIAEEVRELLAELGYRSVEEIIGQTQLLKIGEKDIGKPSLLDVSGLLQQVESSQPFTCQESRNQPLEDGSFIQSLLTQSEEAIEQGQSLEINHRVANTHRSIGANISGAIAEKYGLDGMPNASEITLKLKGFAGQSLGVWNVQGLNIYLEGAANDYVGKGMNGGKIVLYQGKVLNSSKNKSQSMTIAGNTCLYGATGGTFFAHGEVGERFAVRNSGSLAIVEGVGNHCCEYMTGGVVVVLGKTGDNFGAGMTGGLAFVLDEERVFFDRYNDGMVELGRITSEATEDLRGYLKELIALYLKDVRSHKARDILDNFEEYLPKFWIVKPKATGVEELYNQYAGRLSGA